VPWCPLCRSEYREDIEACPEVACQGEALAADLPTDPNVTEIYAAAGPLEARRLAGLLQEAQFEVAISDHTDHVFPTPASAGDGPRIAVISDDVAGAKAFIQSARDDEVISLEGAFLA